MFKCLLALLSMTLMSLTLTSCAQLKKNKSEESQKSHLNPEQVKKLNEDATKRVSRQLKDLALAAKASGKDKVQFLASDMYLKASAAQMEGDFKTGNLIFEHLVELAPDDEFIQKKYAVGLIRTGELEKAQKILETLQKKNSNKDHNAGLILAGVYSSLGKNKLALGTYQEILRQDPKNEDACIFLSKAHALEKNFKQAMGTLRACEKRFKNKGVFSYYMGKMSVDRGQLETAKKHFKNASKLEPDFSQATMALGLVHEEQGKAEEAIKIYKTYLEQKPNDTMILSRLVQLMFTAEKFTEATPFAERLSDYDPENLNLKVKLGILYTDQKKYNKAIATFKELLVAAPGSDKILYYLGAIYQEIKDFENAVDYFTQVPAASGLYQDSSLQAAQMLSSLALQERSEKRAGKFQKRFLDLATSKAKEIPEMEVEFQVLKAGYYENIQENMNAIEALEKVSEKENFSDNHKYYLASLYEKENLHDKIFPLVKTILENNPDDAYAYNFLGYTLLEKGERFDEAYEYISKAVELKPDDGYIRDSLGWYYYKTGDVERALEELHKAVALVPDDISIQKHMAIVYGKLRKFTKAKEFIVNAIGLAKFDTERKQLYEVLKNLDAERIPASFLDD